MNDSESPPVADDRADTSPPPAASDLGKVKAVFGRLGAVGPLAIIAATMPALGGFAVLGFMGVLAPWLREDVGVGMTVYVAGFAILAGLALLPTYAQSVLGGFAFGAVLGSTAALTGIFGASMIGYAVARRASGDKVVELISEQPKWKAVYDALIGGSFLRTLGIVTLLRLPSNSPFAITNLVLAATRVNPLVYAIGTVVGIAPRTIVAAIIGAGLSEWDLSAAKHKWLFVGGIVLTLIVFGIIGAIANRAVRRVTASQKSTA